MDAGDPNLGFGLGSTGMAGPICWGQLSQWQIGGWNSGCVRLHIDVQVGEGMWGVIMGFAYFPCSRGFVQLHRAWFHSEGQGESCVQALESPIWKVFIPGLKGWNSENLSSRYGYGVGHGYLIYRC